ncbi:xanthine dehydrogenase small subunit [Vibrio sp. SS-MA-C1-2]|nr:xanthine dehydrogenase small subunit [Vibrio sp. SS-MA-C1-2]
MTVLNYLRINVEKKGTKEGCGSGDCGACTVVVGEVIDGELKYKSINSCLTFVTSLHGKQLITVEDLKQNNGSLHPVQQAMVEFHGSQCGFCTPGFIMSMFALGKNRPNANKEDVIESLAGNLCRCTGYRPIVDAALSLSSQPDLIDQFTQLEQQTIDRLIDIDKQPASLAYKGLKAFIPRTIDELSQLYQQNPKAKLLAGGTDLSLEVTQFHREIKTLISVNQVDEMKTCRESEHALHLGSNTTISDAYSLLTQHFPDLKELLHRFASLQVRNQGTIGGNIANASPIGDMPPILLSLDAEVKLRQGDKARTIPLSEYFITYKVTSLKESEFIEEIVIPKPEENANFNVYKLSKRLDDDISAVCGAFNLHIENNKIVRARIAFGGMAGIPQRAVNCEKILTGASWSNETIEKGMAALKTDFKPLDDFRASSEYRTLTSINMLRRYFIELNNQNNKIETRVTSYV